MYMCIYLYIVYMSVLFKKDIHVVQDKCALLKSHQVPECDFHVPLMFLYKFKKRRQ